MRTYTRSKKGATVHDPKTGVGETILPNGLRVLTLERSFVPAVVAVMVYPVGGLVEEEGESGAAHFLEHLMFKGSRRYPKGAIDWITGRFGGLNNAFTSRDMTAYYFRFPVEHWERALEIESDRMRNLLFDPSEVEAERAVVLEEIRMNEDSPMNRLDQEVTAASYLYHPYRRPILGWKEDIQRISIPSLRRFYRTHYHPTGATLVLVGDLETTDAISRVRGHFGRLRARPRPRPRTWNEPRCSAERRVHLCEDVAVARVQIVFHSVPRSHPDHTVLDLAANVLSEGRSSRLYERLVQRRRLFLEVEASQIGRCDRGVFEVYGQVRPGVEPRTAERALLREVFSMARRNPSKLQLERARRQYLADLLFAREDLLNHALVVAQEDRFGVLGQLGGLAEEIEKVGPEDVSRVLRDTCSSGGRCVGILQPAGA